MISSRKRYRGECGVRSTTVTLTGGCAFPRAVIDLWRAGVLCDTAISVEGSNFDAHHIVLASCCEYVHRRSVGSWIDASTSITLPAEEVDESTVRAALDFAYMGDCVLAHEGLLPRLLRTAHFLGFSSLLEATINAIRTRLTPQNALAVWTHADALHLPELASTARAMVECNFAVATVGGGWLTSPHTHVEALLDSDHLSAGEVEVYEALLRWIRSRTPTLAPTDVAPLLSRVRFRLMRPTYLKRLVLGDPLLQTIEGQAAYHEAIRIGPRTRGGPPSHISFVLQPTGGLGPSLQKPYLRTSTHVSILHLRRFLSKRLDFPSEIVVVILCKDVRLQDSMSLGAVWCEYWRTSADRVLEYRLCGSNTAERGDPTGLLDSAEPPTK